MLEIKCPACARQLQLPDEAFKQKCQCPTCGGVFLPAEIIQSSGCVVDRVRIGHATEATPSVTPGQTNDADEPEYLADQTPLAPEEEVILGIVDEAGEFRWSGSIRGAILSIVVGGLIWALSLDPDPKEGLCIFLFMAIAAAVLGGAHGSLITWAALATSPSRRAWVARWLGGFLLAAVITSVFIYWQSFPPLYFYLTVGFVALPFMLLLVLIIKWITRMNHMINRSKQ
jgi:hypothetical protein